MLLFVVLSASLTIGGVSFLHMSEYEYPSPHLKILKLGPDLETLHPDLRARYLYLRKFLIENKNNKEAISKEFSKGLDLDLSDPKFANYETREALNQNGNYVVDGNRGWQDDRDGQIKFETRNFDRPYWRLELWYEIPWGLWLERKFGDQMNAPLPAPPPDPPGTVIIKSR